MFSDYILIFFQNFENAIFNFVFTINYRFFSYFFPLVRLCTCKVRFIRGKKVGILLDFLFLGYTKKKKEFEKNECNEELKTWMRFVEISVLYRCWRKMSDEKLARKLEQTNQRS